MIATVCLEVMWASYQWDREVFMFLYKFEYMLSHISSPIRNTICINVLCDIILRNIVRWCMSIHCMQMTNNLLSVCRSIYEIQFKSKWSADDIVGNENMLPLFIFQINDLIHLHLSLHNVSSHIALDYTNKYLFYFPHNVTAW